MGGLAGVFRLRGRGWLIHFIEISPHTDRGTGCVCVFVCALARALA